MLTGDVVREVSALKERLDGEILVYASYQLGRTLLEHDLVDELRLTVFPVTLGAGQRLFGEAGGNKPMRLRRHPERRGWPGFADLSADPELAWPSGITGVRGHRFRS